MTAWDKYLDLLDELGGLAAREAQGIADADTRYQQESRRLQNDVAAAERDHKILADRNAKLQADIRSLTRQLGVAVPSGSNQQPLTGTQLASAMKSAEYDLEQLRRSLAYIETQRPPVQVIAPSTTQTAPTESPSDESVSTTRTPNRAAVTISVAAMLVIVAVVVLLAL